MPSSTRIIHKRGDTFSYGSDDVVLPAGETWIATAQVRDPLAPDTDPPLTILDVLLVPPVAPSVYWDLSLAAPSSETMKWPVNPNYTVPKILVCDIRFNCQSNPQISVSSTTFQILVYRDVTR